MRERLPDELRAVVAGVARALGSLLDRVVFIGGAIAPLLQEDRPFNAPRPTRDVDAVIASVSYAEFERVREELRRLGFREDMKARHMHRWIVPGSSAPLDLVPVGKHAGAMSNPWDEAAIRTAWETEIEPGLTIRHADAPAFVALKLAAFRDRGVDDPHASTDLEDVLALVASRPRIIEEVATAPQDVRRFIAERVLALIDMEEFEDLVAGHLGNVARDRAARAIPLTEDRLTQIAHL